MAAREENDLLTRTGPGTTCGDLMRRYWQPVALADELPRHDQRAPVPVRILGEDLVLFRPDAPGRPDSSGRDDRRQPGLLGLHCAHRGADLSYGRIEDGGLRCIYHGWLYDVHGRCLEQPGERLGAASIERTDQPTTQNFSTALSPSETGGSAFHQRIRHTAYPCREVGGVIYTYMGPGDPPELPPYEFVAIPEEYRINTRVFQDCNYLQGTEGNVDPVHLSFLHRIAPDSAESAQAYNAYDTRPTLETEETEYGVRIYCVRQLWADRQYVRVTNYIVPNASAVSGTADGYTVNWHVPIDDTHHWRYQMSFRRSGPINRDGALWGETGADKNYRLLRNQSNRFLQDREEDRKSTRLNSSHIQKSRMPSSA